jgi:erythromycin esterase
MEALFNYLQVNDPKAADIARQALLCFEPYEEDPHKYARSQYSLESSCRQEVTSLLTEMRKKSPVYDHDPEAALNTEQNAHIAVNAEEYYSNTMNFNDNTWNLRDTHMMETLQRLLKFHGSDAKAIVWEHNTHIGDARYTDMQRHGMHNTGQLAREQLGAPNTVLAGFGSYQGSVIAGKHWGAAMEVMPVPEARQGSVEEFMHKRYAGENRLLIFDQNGNNDRLDEVMPHRAIGVVYNPVNEKHGNYVPSILSSRYDAFLYIDQTTAVHPLHLKPDSHLVPETYPFNF